MVITNGAGPALENGEQFFEVLSSEIPNDKVTGLLNELGFNYTKVKNVLKENHNEYAATVKHFLVQWELGGGATRGGLDNALRNHQLGGLCRIVDKHFSQDDSSDKKMSPAMSDRSGASASPGHDGIKQSGVSIHATGIRDGSIIGQQVNITNTTTVAKKRKSEQMPDVPQDESESEDEDDILDDKVQGDVKEARPSENELDPSKCYKMDSKLQKGRILIINNYKNVKDSKVRKGSTVDVENVERVFEQLGFECTIHTDMKAKEMKKALKRFQKKVDNPQNDAVGNDAVVIFIMTHGNEKSVCGTDNEPIERSYVRQCLMSMKSMIGKPKIVFYQACEGSDVPEMVECDEAVSSEEDDVQSDDAPQLLTNNADIYEASATSKGYKAFRSPKSGSWFVNCLCCELINNAHQYDLDTMMEHVTDRLAHHKGEKKGKAICQTPSVTKTLRKKIYLLPKYPPQK